MDEQINTLIIAAHGSRKKASNIEVEKLVQRLAGQVTDPDFPGRFDRVMHAFLQLADPLLETALKQAVADGAAKVVVFPFFIGSGSHILEDIPALVEGVRSTHPEVEFVLTRHLGKLAAIEQVIIDEVTGSGTSHTPGS